MDNFEATFGASRGNAGARDARTGADSDAARAHIAHLAGCAREGQVEGALELLRERATSQFDKRHFDEPALAPLLSGIVAFAKEQALGEQWLTAAACFCELTGLLSGDARCVVRGSENVLHLWAEGAQHVTPESERDEVTWVCGHTMSWAKGKGEFHSPPYPLHRARRGEWARAAKGPDPRRLTPTLCSGCAEHAHEFPECSEQGGGSVFEALDRGQYEQLLELWLAAELRRGSSHLRTRADVESWLCACAVQGVLIESLCRALRDAQGEDAFHRTLGAFTYRQLLADAREHGVLWLHELPLQDAELERTVCHLLPGAGGRYEPPYEVRQEFEIDSYRAAIAAALTRLEQQRASVPRAAPDAHPERRT